MRKACILRFALLATTCGTFLVGCSQQESADSAPSETAPVAASRSADAGGSDATAEASVVADKPASGGNSAEGEAVKSDAGESSAASLYSPEAFREAALNGKRRVVEVCLDSGMKVDEADPRGYTALAMAAYNGHADVVKLLLDHGATVDVRDAKGNTPLILAASGPAPQTVAVLLDAGADINAVDSDEHYTPLMTAAALGNAEVVKVLLEQGAKTDMVDADGESALDFAKENGHAEIVKLLSAE